MGEAWGVGRLLLDDAKRKRILIFTDSRNCEIMKNGVADTTPQPQTHTHRHNW